MAGKETVPTDKNRTAPMLRGQRTYVTQWKVSRNAIARRFVRLLLSARTQREIEAAYEAADRYLRQYPEDRDLIYAASQQTYSRELQLRRSGDWQD